MALYTGRNNGPHVWLEITMDKAEGRVVSERWMKYIQDTPYVSDAFFRGSYLLWKSSSDLETKSATLMFLT